MGLTVSAALIRCDQFRPPPMASNRPLNRAPGASTLAGEISTVVARASVQQPLRPALRKLANVGLIVREIAVDLNYPDNEHTGHTTITINQIQDPE